MDKLTGKQYDIYKNLQNILIGEKNEDCAKAVGYAEYLIQKERTELAIKALEAYLSAGTKQSRKEASVLAKQAYKELTGKDYENPKT